MKNKILSIFFSFSMLCSSQAIFGKKLPEECRTKFTLAVTTFPYVTAYLFNKKMEQSEKCDKIREKLKEAKEELSSLPGTCGPLEQFISIHEKQMKTIEAKLAEICPDL